MCANSNNLAHNKVGVVNIVSVRKYFPWPNAFFLKDMYTPK